MNEVACNYCGANDTRLVNQGADLLLRRLGNFRLVRCQRCGLIYQNPQLSREELLQHYPDEYVAYQQGIEGDSSFWQHLNRSQDMRRRCQHITRYFTQPGSVLDVGCATGSFLVAMRDRGWQVEGIELSPYAADYCRTQHQLKVYTGALEEAKIPENRYDLVTLWDVLEHVIDPKTTLQMIAHILKPGGLLVASVPNPNSYEARIFSDAWIGWDRPRHLHIFSEEMLEKYFNLTGFEKLPTKSFSGYLAIALFNLDFVMSQRGISEQKWQPWRKFFYNPLFRLLTAAPYRLLGAMNKLTVMTAFAKVKK